MRKLWLDVETTGLDKDKNGIIQLACIDEVTKEKFTINIKPFKGCVYTKDAEEIHGKTEKIISKYVPEGKAIHQFIDWLEKLQIVDEQFSIAGYNSRFDMDFITAWFKRNKKNYWKLFNYYDVDVFALVKILDLEGNDPVTGIVCKKLGAICNTMGVKLDNAHDALADITATRKLHKKIMKRYVK